MERLQFVGISADGRVVFVLPDPREPRRFEVELTPELAEAVAGLEPAPPAEEERREREDGHVRVLSTGRAAARSHGGLAPGAFERATGFGGGVPEPRGVRALLGAAAASPEDPVPVLVEAPEAPPSAPRLFPVPPQEAVPTAGRTGGVRVSRTRLSTGEIQGLLRAGRSPRSVAEQAGAPLEWVRRLDETVSRERLLAVGQMLHVPMTRPHQGLADRPVGDAVLESLRRRRVAAPERALEQGWSASRPPGGEWRVRFAYDHRGESLRADWTYEPRLGRVLPLNDLASELGWSPEAG